MNTQHLIFIAGSSLLSLLVWTIFYYRNKAIRNARLLNLNANACRQVELDLKLASLVFDNVNAAMFIADQHARIIKVNPAFTAITGYTAQEAIGKTPSILASGIHTSEFYQLMWSTLKTTGNWQGEIINRQKNGAIYTEWLSINTVHDRAGNTSHFVAYFSDISDQKAAELHLHNLAHYDVLTGLPNRTLLADRMQQAIAAAKRDKSHMALIFIDLDKFKPVNDALGHLTGDQLLKEVAKRMLACLRESDSAARIGGDEFIVLLPLIESALDAVAVAEKIRHSLNQVFEIEDYRLNISSSSGVAVYPEHGENEETLLRHADMAMYIAKGLGRNNVTLFDFAMKHSNS